MNARHSNQTLPAWVKLAAALLLAAILLSGLLAGQAAAPVQAIIAPPQANAPGATTVSGVNGTLTSFTALITQVFTIDIPFTSP